MLLFGSFLACTLTPIEQYRECAPADSIVDSISRPHGKRLVANSAIDAVVDFFMADNRNGGVILSFLLSWHRRAQ